MDETYIKMCDCPEIQEQKKRDIRPSGFDWDFIQNYEDWNGEYVSAEGEVSLHCGGCNSEYGGRGLRSTTIWLPRQDQLQAMVEHRHQVQNKYFQWFWNGVYHNAGWLYYRGFTSMEQLWLAFVMKEKFNKVWTGTEWNNAS